MSKIALAAVIGVYLVLIIAGLYHAAQFKGGTDDEGFVVWDTHE